MITLANNNNNNLSTKTIRCTLCNRMFQTAQGHMQHMLTVHGVGTSNVIMDNNNNVVTRGNRRLRNQRRRIRRRRNLGAISNYPSNSNMGVVPYNPSVNQDGTAYNPSQTMAERYYGSSAIDEDRRNGVLSRDERGIMSAVSNIIASTPDGKAWALAALHPCGAGEIIDPSIGEVRGMCDTMTGSVATPVYRSENHHAFSTDVFQGVDPTTLGKSTYGIDIIVPPIPEIDYLYRFIDDGTGVKSRWVVVRQPNFDLPAYTDYPTAGDHGYTVDTCAVTMASTGYGKTRIIAMGHTFELDAAGLNDQGRVVVGQMEGHWLRQVIAPPSTNTQTAPFVTDVGPPVVTGDAVTQVFNLGAESGSELWFLSIPTDPATIVSNCPNAYQGLAKYGAYVVTKFTSPLLGYAFKRTGSEQVYAALGGPGEDPRVMPKSAFAIYSLGYECDSSLTNADSFFDADTNKRSAFGNTFIPVAAETGGLQLNGRLLHPFVTEPSDMMTSVIMFRNLPAATMTGGLTSSIRIKSRSYLECISAGSNPAVAPYVHPPAPFDFRALNSVIVAGKQLGDAYPACDNSLGTILSKVWSAISGPIAGVANIVGGLRIPVLSDVSRFIGDTIGGADALRSRFR